jgi:hypothetical protein
MGQPAAGIVGATFSQAIFDHIKAKIPGIH